MSFPPANASRDEVRAYLDRKAIELVEQGGAVFVRGHSPKDYERIQALNAKREPKCSACKKVPIMLWAGPVCRPCARELLAVNVVIR